MDDVWNENDSEFERKQHERDMARIESISIKEGFREVAEEARDAAVQSGFNSGLKDGLSHGFAWGILWGEICSVLVHYTTAPLDPASERVVAELNVLLQELAELNVQSVCEVVDVTSVTVPNSAPGNSSGICCNQIASTELIQDGMEVLSSTVSDSTTLCCHNINNFDANGTTPILSTNANRLATLRAKFNKMCATLQWTCSF